MKRIEEVKVKIKSLRDAEEPNVGTAFLGLQAAAEEINNATDQMNNLIVEFGDDDEQWDLKQMLKITMAAIRYNAAYTNFRLECMRLSLSVRQEILLQQLADIRNTLKAFSSSDIPEGV